MIGCRTADIKGSFPLSLLRPSARPVTGASDLIVVHEDPMRDCERLLIRPKPHLRPSPRLRRNLAQDFCRRVSMDDTSPEENSA